MEYCKIKQGSALFPSGWLAVDLFRKNSEGQGGTVSAAQREDKEENNEGGLPGRDVT
ncbi:hypothetical protein J6590_002226 [Homalodisca vitripennis]|nr:hypothetical protein J6590_002226 [Homalodisca vitripennis]